MDIFQQLEHEKQDKSYAHKQLLREIHCSELDLQLYRAEVYELDLQLRHAIKKIDICMTQNIKGSMSSLLHHGYVLDELTANKFSVSSLKHADLSDYMLYQNGNLYTPYAYVYKDLSPVCHHEGYSVFAARDIPKHTPVTFYAGRLYSHDQQHLKPHQNSDYVYELADGKHMLDGLWIDPEGPWWTRYGIGHLLNDNIHVHATGHHTNAYFAEVDIIDHNTHQRFPRVVVVTLKDIAQGEELFVSYSLEHWLYWWHHSKNGNVDLSTSSFHWLSSMNTLVQELIQRMYAHGRLLSDVEKLEHQFQEISISEEMTYDVQERVPFVGHVYYSDMYENPDYCPTCEFYDICFDTEVREGAFDLVFTFDEPCDMVCCPWHTSDDLGHECRLTVVTYDEMVDF